MSTSIYVAAQDKKQIYNFKGQFNQAMQQILNGANIMAQLERADSQLPTSRIEMQFNLGEAQNQGAIAGDLVYDFFQGNRLDIRIVTLRPMDSPSPLPGVITMHDNMVATIFAVMEERLRPFDPFLPYYQVNMIRPRQTQSGLDTRFLEDWTLITFEVWFGIRPSSWPAGS